jgi:hypothetical protein
MEFRNPEIQKCATESNLTPKEFFAKRNVPETKLTCDNATNILYFDNASTFSFQSYLTCEVTKCKG